jgi:hypothetical protein
VVFPQHALEFDLVLMVVQFANLNHPIQLVIGLRPVNANYASLEALSGPHVSTTTAGLISRDDLSLP